MKFIKRWIYNIVKSYETKARSPISVLNGGVSVDADHLDSQSALNFRVHFAAGGRVVQINHYDHKIDRNFQRLYIITEDKNFGEELDKIITLEGIRR
jgi:hypothetical protein